MQQLLFKNNWRLSLHKLRKLLCCFYAKCVIIVWIYIYRIYCCATFTHKWVIVFRVSSPYKYAIVFGSQLRIQIFATKKCHTLTFRDNTLSNYNILQENNVDAC